MERRRLLSTRNGVVLLGFALGACSSDSPVEPGDAAALKDAHELLDAAFDSPFPPPDSSEIPAEDGSLEAQEASKDPDSAEVSIEDGFERGFSAWIYENRQQWVDAMMAYDASVPGQQRLSYLFPYVGGVEFTDSSFGSQSVWFDTKVADYHATHLPKARLLPAFDSADGDVFASWNEVDQRKFANEVADKLLSIDKVAGVHIDIEPFRIEHLPFYEELGERIHSEDKLLTVFTGSTSGEIYGLADVVVFSGYDLGIFPVTPQEYMEVLQYLVGEALQSAASTGARLMVGVPITAAWEQYATQSGTCHETTGFTQEHWFGAALEAICPHVSHASFFGLGLWGFYGDALEIPRGSGCFHHPGTVSEDNWGALTSWGNGNCL